MTRKPNRRPDPCHPATPYSHTGLTTAKINLSYVALGPGLEPCVPTDFQRLMRVDPEKAFPRYVFWRLQHDWASGLTRSYSRRTTGITNLSVTEYIAREVPVPSAEEQAELTQRAEAVEALVVTLRAEAASLRQIRAGLLSELLDPTANVESANLEVV